MFDGLRQVDECCCLLKPPIHPTSCIFLVRIQKLPRLLVTTSDGHLYLYNLDPQDGGECVLIKKHRWWCSSATHCSKCVEVDLWHIKGTIAGYNFALELLNFVAGQSSCLPPKPCKSSGVFPSSSTDPKWVLIHDLGRNSLSTLWVMGGRLVPTLVVSLWFSCEFQSVDVVYMIEHPSF